MNISRHISHNGQSEAVETGVPLVSPNTSHALHFSWPLDLGLTQQLILLLFTIFHFRCELPLTLASFPPFIFRARPGRRGAGILILRSLVSPAVLESSDPFQTRKLSPSHLLQKYYYLHSECPATDIVCRPIIVFGRVSIVTGK